MQPNTNSFSDFKVERCRQTDIDNLLSFFKKMRSTYISFLPTERNDVLNKYRGHKDNSENLNLFVLKDRNGQIVGCSGYVPFKGTLGGQRIVGFIGSDAIIEPQMRAKFPLLSMLIVQHYEKLVRQERPFPLILICPANQEISKAFRKVQWGEFTYIYKFVSESITNILPDIKQSSIEFVRIKEFDKAMASFFERISSQHLFLLNSDVDFLNWKYFSNPYGKYVVLAAIKNNNIIGYVVAEKRLSDIFILDITIDLNYPKVILLLLFEVFKYFDIVDLTVVDCCLSHKKYIEIFKKAGFFSNWKIECLFFKVGLIFSQVKQNDFYSFDNTLYHLNGYAQHLY